jgi:hypothetical protein
MRYKLFLSFSLLICFLIVSPFYFRDAESYPKFAAYTGEKCIACHINPTGGAIRHMGGIKYSKDELYMKMFKKLNKDTLFNPQLTKGIQIGADMRTLFLDDQIAQGQPNQNSFFQMQADLYVNARINKFLNLVIAPSLQYNVFPPVYEVYGMVSNLPAGLYIRAGKFKPNFGIKIPEHRAYERIANLNTPYNSDPGLEAGISPGPFTLTAGFFNGVNTNGSLVNTLPGDLDSDPGKEAVASGDFRWATKDSKFTFGLGASFLSNPYKYSVANNINAVRQIVAGFISVGLFERVAILGEFDYNRLDIRDSVSTREDLRTIFGEVDIRVIQGVEAKFQVENYNPELGTKDPPEERFRYSFGVGIFPLTGLELETIFRLVQSGDHNPDLHNDEFQQTFKFYF